MRLSDLSHGRSQRVRAFFLWVEPNPGGSEVGAPLWVVQRTSLALSGTCRLSVLEPHTKSKVFVRVQHRGKNA